MSQGIEQNWHIKGKMFFFCEEQKIILARSSEVGWISVWFDSLTLWCHQGPGFFLFICFAFCNVDFILKLTPFLVHKPTIRMSRAICLLTHIYRCSLRSTVSLAQKLSANCSSLLAGLNFVICSYNNCVEIMLIS